LEQINEQKCACWSPSRICITMQGSENVNILFAFELVKWVPLHVEKS